MRQNADIEAGKACPGENFLVPFFVPLEAAKKYARGKISGGFRWNKEIFSSCIDLRRYIFQREISKQNIDESRVLWYSRRANGRARSFFYAQKHEEKPEKI